MIIGPGPDQIGLRANAREVLAAACPMDVVHQALTDTQCWRKVWSAIVELGWPALSGRDFRTIDLVVVLEECGAALVPAPIVSSIGMAASVLHSTPGAFGDALAELDDGAVAVLAAQPPDSRSPRPPLRVANGRLVGSAGQVGDLPRAELIVTFATDGERTVAALIRPGAGVHIDETPSIDPTRPLGNLRVDTVAEATTPVDFDTALAIPTLAAAAELVGVASAALDRSVEHAQSRTQFDKPIGSFQGVKHALADNYVALERARSLTYAAASALDGSGDAQPDAWMTAALAKAAAGDAALRCSRTAVQVHGAIAQTWEHDMHLYARRAWQSAALLGDSRALYHAAGRRFLAGHAA